MRSAAIDATHRTHSLARIIASLLLGTLVGVGCVTREHRDLTEARDAHASCVEAKGASHPDCELLEARLREVQDRYEDRARRAWSCDTSPEECPRER